MDNKISELKEKFAAKYAGDNFPNKSSWEFNTEYKSYQKGFQAAMELQLPVLFAEWKQLNTNSIYSIKDMQINYHYITKDFDDLKTKHYTTKELYDYFIQNIYQPEK